MSRPARLSADCRRRPQVRADRHRRIAGGYASHGSATVRFLSQCHFTIPIYRRQRNWAGCLRGAAGHRGDLPAEAALGAMRLRFAPWRLPGMLSPASRRATAGSFSTLMAAHQAENPQAPLILRRALGTHRVMANASAAFHRSGAASHRSTLSVCQPTC